jgi:hypothetical protein
VYADADANSFGVRSAPPQHRSGSDEVFRRATSALRRAQVVLGGAMSSGQHAAGRRAPQVPDGRAPFGVVHYRQASTSAWCTPGVAAWGDLVEFCIGQRAGRGCNRHPGCRRAGAEHRRLASGSRTPSCPSVQRTCSHWVARSRPASGFGYRSGVFNRPVTWTVTSSPRSASRSRGRRPAVPSRHRGVTTARSTLPATGKLYCARRGMLTGQHVRRLILQGPRRPPTHSCMLATTVPATTRMPGARAYGSIRRVAHRHWVRKGTRRGRTCISPPRGRLVNLGSASGTNIASLAATCRRRYASIRSHPGTKCGSEATASSRRGPRADLPYARCATIRPSAAPAPRGRFPRAATRRVPSAATRTRRCRAALRCCCPWAARSDWRTSHISDGDDGRHPRGLWDRERLGRACRPHAHAGILPAVPARRPA